MNTIKIFISCNENIQIFTRASHSWKYWCFHYTRWQYLWYSQEKSKYPLFLNWQNYCFVFFALVFFFWDYTGAEPTYVFMGDWRKLYQNYHQIHLLNPGPTEPWYALSWQISWTLLPFLYISYFTFVGNFVCVNFVFSFPNQILLWKVDSHLWNPGCISGCAMWNALPAVNGTNFIIKLFFISINKPLM